MQALQDVYPTRVNGEPQMMPRQDPPVHGQPGQAPLGEQQLTAYKEKGYLFLPSFFSAAETTEMQEQLERLFGRYKGSDAPEVILEPDGDEVRSVFAVHDRDEYFHRVARRGRLLAIVEQLLGSDVYIHQSRINFKPGFAGKGFDWHSDFETWHAEDGMPRMRAVSCSVALTDNFHCNGPLMLVPGSHQHFVACVGATPEENYKSSLRRQEVGVPDPKSLTWLAQHGGGIDVPVGPAGSVILFECNTMHGSNSNMSPYPRSNLFMVYNSVQNALVEPFAGTKPRPEYVAHRDFTPLTPVE